jgi:signal peptidase II
MNVRLSTVRFKRNLLIVILLVGCVGCDQLTKDVAQQYLALEAPRSWFHDTVRLEYAENTGAFLSLGSGFSERLRVILFQVFPALWLVGLVIVLLVAKQMPSLSVTAWSLVLSGGIGNLIDRLFHDGRVIDFMNIGIGSLRTGIFNVADVCITIGVSLLVLELLQRPRVSVIVLGFLP